MRKEVTMKIIKIILILAFLISISLGVFGNTSLTTTDITTYDYSNSDWYRNHCYIDKPEPKTLSAWFDNLKLEEKVKIYNDWNKKDYFYTDTSPDFIITW